eukprot:COSAG01_NODE_861_length_13035_cov_6.890449_9_plen_161_part_00
MPRIVSGRQQAAGSQVRKSLLIGPSPVLQRRPAAAAGAAAAASCSHNGPSRCHPRSPTAAPGLCDDGATSVGQRAGRVETAVRILWHVVQRAHQHHERDAETRHLPARHWPRRSSIDRSTYQPISYWPTSLQPKGRGGGGTLRARAHLLMLQHSRARVGY